MQEHPAHIMTVTFVFDMMMWCIQIRGVVRVMMGLIVIIVVEIV